MLTSEVDEDSLWNVKLKQTVHSTGQGKDTDRTRQSKDMLENGTVGWQEFDEVHTNL